MTGNCNSYFKLSITWTYWKLVLYGLLHCLCKPFKILTTVSLLCFFKSTQTSNLYCLNHSPTRPKNCLDDVFKVIGKFWLLAKLLISLSLIIELKNMSNNNSTNILPLVGNALKIILPKKSVDNIRLTLALLQIYPLRTKIPFAYKNTLCT